MVKLSDALRGAADRAPLDGVTVSTDAAARRVSMNRGLRGTATGIVGVTAIGVIALGVIGPHGLASADSAMDRDVSAAEAAPAQPNAGADGLAGAADSQLAWGLCGQPGATPADWQDSVFSLAASTPAEAEPGSSLPVEVQAALQDASVDDSLGLSDNLLTTAPSALVLWDGIVVGSLPAEPVTDFGPADQQILNEDANLISIPVAEGESHSFSVDVPLVNCWDGAPLPAGKYELLATQDFIAWGEFPADQSLPAPTPTASEATPTDAAASDEPDVAGPIPGAEAGTSEPTVLASFTASAEPVGFTIKGDPAENPFDQYLGAPEPSIDPPVDPPTDVPPPAALPDGTLTADVARQMYQAGLNESRWDMAAGTQRWLVTNDSAAPYTDEGWRASFFGCPMDGQTDGRFPKQSATMNLMDVSGDFPAQIKLSYGWVVDGNPEFSMTARNVSEYTLNNFQPSLSSQLYLVKNGVVVAEAWGVSPYQNQGAVMYGTGDQAALGAADGRDMATIVAPDAYPTPALTPGQFVSSTFLWREVQGCWNGSGQTTVTPGTYTLVSSQYVPIGTSQIYYAEPQVQLESSVDASVLPFSSGSGSDSTLNSGGGSSASSDVAIAPAPDPVNDQYDTVEMQVWTSFGTITVN